MHHTNVALLSVLRFENKLKDVFICFGSWSAKQVIGEPNVYPTYGDHAGAWASKGFVSEWIEVNVYHLCADLTIALAYLYYAKLAYDV